MSSTNRGSDRNISDYYITPISEIIKFKTEAEKFIDFNNKVIIDPCSGGDKDNPMSYPSVFNVTTTIDIRKDSLADIKEDFLNINTPADIFITNPPFNIAENIMLHALDLVNNNGYVILLLRLNYFGSRKRNKWLLNNMPEYCFIHSKRMSFTKNGSTDSIEYAHFIWKKNYHPNYTKTYLLPFL